MTCTATADLPESKLDISRAVVRILVWVYGRERFGCPGLDCLQYGDDLLLSVRHISAPGCFVFE